MTLESSYTCLACMEMPTRYKLLDRLPKIKETKKKKMKSDQELLEPFKKPKYQVKKW